MDSTYQYDLVCIGSGPAGQRGAIQAAKLGRRVALVERRGIMGGVCVGTGTIPSKTFREAVLSFATSGGDWDRRRLLRPNQRATSEQLLARVDDVVKLECQLIENQLRRNDVDVISGEATFKDPHTLVIHTPEGSSREITAANILIAVGSVPTPAPGATSDGETIITSDEIISIKRMPKTLTVVGAGVIGIEYASMFGAVGVEVVIVDRRQRPLEFLDQEI
ncbi:MAG: FAD-dependent oxidoreductase, partial [Gemmatimonadota bacterium]